MKILLSTFLFLSFSFCQKTGKDIIQKMYDKYQGKWYKTLTFEQKTTFFAADTISRIQTWHEAIRLPNQLHIKFGDKSEGNGMMFSADSQYVFRAHKLVQKRAMLHPLVILGFAVYGQSPEKTAKELEKLNFDLNTMSEDIWQGRAVYVIGAKRGELKKNQFWIDKEHLYFVRSLNYNSQRESLSETEFNKYRRHKGGWLAPEVIFKRNGKVVLLEEYESVKSPKSLSDKLFDVKTFLESSW